MKWTSMPIQKSIACQSPPPHLSSALSVLLKAGKDDDDIKVDNVICRTPARNAQSLDMVKQEIMDMVEKVVSEDDSPTDKPMSLSDEPI